MSASQRPRGHGIRSPEAASAANTAVRTAQSTPGHHQLGPGTGLGAFFGEALSMPAIITLQIKRRVNQTESRMGQG